MYLISMAYKNSGGEILIEGKKVNLEVVFFSLTLPPLLKKKYTRGIKITRIVQLWGSSEDVNEGAFLCIAVHPAAPWQGDSLGASVLHE